MQIVPIVTILAGALILRVAARLARRIGIPESSGYGVALILISGVAVFLLKHPQTWVSNNDSAERTLTFAREIGVTGLFFLAGIRFPLEEVWKAKRAPLFIAAAGLFGMAVTAGLIGVLGNQAHGAKIVLGAAIVGTSLWLPSELFHSENGNGTLSKAAANGAAVVLTVLSLLLLHFYSILDGFGGRAAPGSAYMVVLLYELVKVIVFFSLAYYISSRFLALSKEKISTFRTLIAYLVISVLVFTLAVLTVGRLAALAWAFIAGATLHHAKVGEKWISQPAPVAVAIFLSSAFIPLLLQSHGRSLKGTAVVFVALLVALIGKFALVAAGARVAGVSGREAGVIAAATLGSGETAVLILGFGMSKWLIEGPSYFGILAFALASMVIGPMIWQRMVSKRGTFGPVVNSVPRQSGRGSSASKLGTHLFVLCLCAVLISFTASLQAAPIEDRSPSPPTASPKDAPSGSPQKMEAILEAFRRKVDRQAELSELVSQAQILYRIGEEAYKKGDAHTAESNFSRAQQMLLSQDEGIFYEPGVHIYFLQLARQIAVLKGSSGVPYHGKSQLDFRVNDQVRAFMKYYQGKGQNVVRNAFARLNLYEAMMRKTFQEEGVPEDLIYVGLVESAFNPHAQSEAGAEGMWQFIPDTGRRYGLKQVGTRDDRHDPEKSTRAAARYLRDLYEIFEDWPLALASYNAGEYRVLQAIRRTGIKDFWQMSRQGLLPQETRNYVPAVLAAIALGRQASQKKPNAQPTLEPAAWISR